MSHNYSVLQGMDLWDQSFYFIFRIEQLHNISLYGSAVIYSDTKMSIILIASSLLISSLPRQADTNSWHDTFPSCNIIDIHILPFYLLNQPYFCPFPQTLLWTCQPGSCWSFAAWSSHTCPVVSMSSVLSAASDKWCTTIQTQLLTLMILFISSTDINPSPFRSNTLKILLKTYKQVFSIQTQYLL